MTQPFEFFTPRTPENERLKLSLSEEDKARVLRRGRGPGRIGIITDLTTNKRYDCYGASCGIPECYCDAIAHLLED